MSKINEDINRIKEVMYEMKTVSKNRLVLNFPNQNNWERLGSKIAKITGLVTERFKDIGQATNWINLNHSLLNKPLDTLIIGSHGTQGNSGIMSVSGNEQTLLKEIASKGMVGNGTTVFFTACYGAEKVFQLMTASQILGVPVYACRGIYNYVTNTSEDGFVRIHYTGNNIYSVIEKEYPEHYRKVVMKDDSAPIPHGLPSAYWDFAYAKGYMKTTDVSPITWL